MKEFKPEEWCVISGYRYYQISNHGKIKSLSRIIKDENGIRTRKVPECILKQKTDDLGYKRVNLRADYDTISHLAHQLVGNAFVPNPRNLKEINHKFGNPSDNYFEHLEWCTHKENMEHASQTGLMKHWCQGVIQILENGLTKSFKSIREASRLTGISKSGIEYNLNTNKIMKKYKCKFKTNKYELK